MFGANVVQSADTAPLFLSFANPRLFVYRFLSSPCPDLYWLAQSVWAATYMRCASREPDALDVLICSEERLQILVITQNAAYQSMAAVQHLTRNLNEVQQKPFELHSHDLH